MKKAVVYFLTAVLVTGASLPSTVAYAETVSDSEAVTDKAEAVSEETPEATQTEEKTANSEAPDTSTESTEQKTPDTPDTTKGQETPETDEDSKEVAFDLKPNMNLDAVREYIRSADTLGTTVVYFMKKDAIVLGYNYSSGDVVTSTLKNVTDTS